MNNLERNNCLKWFPSNAQKYINYQLLGHYVQPTILCNTTGCTAFFIFFKVKTRKKKDCPWWVWMTEQINLTRVLEKHALEMTLEK